CVGVICCFFCVFFFQAEDGIRDRTVTGVQTCALPIFDYLRYLYGLFDLEPRRELGPRLEVEEPVQVAQIVDAAVELGRNLLSGRSEERRVGKERRTRGGRKR